MLLDYLDEDLQQVVLRHGGQRVSARGTEVCTSFKRDLLLLRDQYVLVSIETYYYLYWCQKRTDKEQIETFSR